MSLKFGIYLVEQRIVTPEQFCGLVKIQQESTRSLASLAISQNYLTMKQVSRILDEVKEDDAQFIQFALDKGLIDKSDASHLVKLQERSGEDIRSLAVECGLLTARQSEVLFNHFQRYGARTAQVTRRQVSAPTAPPHASVSTEQAARTSSALPPKQAPSPKFKQRPIIKVEEIQH